MAKRGRKRKPISEAMQRVICSLISTGSSDRHASRMTGVRPYQWRRLASDDANFCSLLDKAEQERCGLLAVALREAMFDQIRKGHPWWAKLAIHNYDVALRDPDVAGAAQRHRMLADALQPKFIGLLTDDPSLADAPLPPGAMPGV